MSEQHNVEIAHALSEQKLAEHGMSPASKRRWEEVFEIVELAFLAIIAIATAWSGYQAARWDGHQAILYGQATRLRFEADAASTRGGQQLVSNSGMFNAWLQAHDEGNQGLERQFERRFTPDYHVAFEAWLATDPFTNPNAPPGPGFMPQLHNPLLEQSERLNVRAEALFDEGTTARETADKYVRDTVLFASVLFLIAVAQRFKLRNVRFGANALALGLLAVTLYTLAVLPRF